MRVFVCHAGSDRQVAIAVHGYLSRAGHEVFLDFDRDDGVRVGEEWKARLYRQLRAADAVVCLVSSASLASLWCGIEIATAEALGARVLPLSLEPELIHPLLEAVHHIDYTAADNAALSAIEAALRLATSLSAGRWADGQNPYPGMRAFDSEWQRVFFGRDLDIRHLAATLRQPDTGGLVAVVGPSGCGKSSLVRAGLMPDLSADSGWWVLPAVLPGTDPLRALAVELAAEGVRLGRDWSVSTLEEMLRQPHGLAGVAEEILVGASVTSRRRRLLVVIDQFEEVLTLADAERRERLGAALTDTGPATVVITVRPEFLTTLLADPYLSTLDLRTVPVRPIAFDKLATIITEPVRVAGITLPDGLVARLVADTATTDALPLLAFTLHQLADGVGRGGELSERRYDELDGVAGSLIRQADGALREASARTDRSDGDVLAGLLSLVTVDEAGQPTRRRVSLADLPDHVQAAMEAFISRRLVIIDTIAGFDTVTVAHEAFLTAWPPLAQIIDSAEAALRSRREVEAAADFWHRHGRNRSQLWQQGQLSAAVTALQARPQRSRTLARFADTSRNIITTTVDVSVTAAQFLRASIRRDRWLRRRAVTVLAALLALVTVSAIGAFAARQQALSAQRTAEDRQRLATARQLIAQGQALEDRDPRTGLRLAMAGYHLVPNAETQTGLFTTVTSTALSATLAGHYETVTATAFSGDGRTLAVASFLDEASAQDNAVGELTGEGSLRLWDLSDRTRPRPIGQPVIGHDGRVFAVALSPDGRTLATNTVTKTLAGLLAGHGRVQLWDVSGHTPKPVGAPLTDAGNSIAFSPDGRTFVNSTSDGTVLWNVTDPARPQALGRPFPGGHGAVSSVVFSPKGHKLAIASVEFTSGSSVNPDQTPEIRAESTVRLWDLSSRTTETQGLPLTGQNEWVNSMAFSPDERMVATGNTVGTVRLWNVSDRTPKSLDPPLTVSTGVVQSVVFGPSGRTLAAVAINPGFSGTARLWDLSDRTDPQSIRPPLTGPTEVAFSLGGVGVARFSPDGHTLATGTRNGSSGDGTVRLWDVSDRTRPQPLGPPVTDQTSVYTAAFSPDGHTMATATENLLGEGGTAQLWDLSDRTRPQPLGPPLAITKATVFAMAFDLAGTTLVTGDSNGNVRLWNLADRTQPQPVDPPFTGLNESVTAVAFSADGSKLAVGTDNGIVRLWNISDQTRPQFLAQVVADPVNKSRPELGLKNNGSLTFSPDGRMLAIGGMGRQRLWDLSDPTRPQPVDPTRTGLDNGWHVVALSPDGRTLATTGIDLTVRLWDLSDLTRPRPLGQPLTGQNELVTSMVFSPDGRTLAASTTIVGGGGGDIIAVRLWDLSDQTHPQNLNPPLTEQIEVVTSVVFSPDGRTLATAGGGVVRLWDVGSLLELRRNALGAGCVAADGGFNQEQWARYITDYPYRETCAA